MKLFARSLTLLLLAGALPDHEAHAQSARPRAAVPPALRGTGPAAPQPPSEQEQAKLRAARALKPRATPAAPYQVNTASREAVRLFYKTVFTSSEGVPSGWTGQLATCAAGSVSAAYQEASLRRINWFRAMAGVPAGVTLHPAYSAKAQQTALMMSAHKQLSHYPDANWTCYSADGAEGARNSNLALGRAGPDAVANGYISDGGGNNAAVGHRRWLLYPQTQVMGVGDASPEGQVGGSPANAVWVLDGNYGQTRPAVRDDFVAWPPQGFVPYTAVYPRWSISYPGADFSGATVTMTQNGSPLATRLEPVSAGAGEPTLVWFPGSYSDGALWAAPAQDTRYGVTVANVRVNGQVRSFQYAVTVFDPEVAGSDTPPLQPQGSTTLAAGQTSRFTFSTGVPGSDYQWRSVDTTPYSLLEGAEGASTAFTPLPSASYAIVDSEVSAGGARSFHLTHADAAEPVLLLKDVLVPGASASVSFASRLGLASSQQVAMVEVSADEGVSWQPLYRQAGQQSGSTSSWGETSFTTRTVSLAAYADRAIRLRWRYARNFGSYYPQASRGIGWYVDDIAVTGADRVASTSQPQPTQGGSFDFTPLQEGVTHVQVRAGLYGYYDSWSALRRVNVTGAVSAATAVQVDCLLNWAERQFPALLTPRAVTRTDVPPFRYRYYSDTQSYVGVSYADQHLYYLPSNGVMQDLGLVSAWLSSAACR